MGAIEKILTAWECCNTFHMKCNDCPYDADCYHDGFPRLAISDAVNLLRLKENQEVKTAEWHQGQGGTYCSYCKCDVPCFIQDWKWKECRTKFCPNCGSFMTNAEEGEQDG